MKIEVYKVDKDIPLPEPRAGGNVPINDLKVGESILFPIEERPRVQSLASQIKARKGKEFTVRIVDESNCRVWRTK